MFDMRTASRGTVMSLAIAALVVSAVAIPGDYSAFAAAPSEETWNELKPDLFGERKLLDGTGRYALEAPYRAHDAALVPITIRLLKPQRPGSYVKAVTLVIDENPAPVAAVFTLGEDARVSMLSTRVRVNSYSHIRAIAELSDGSLYMVKRFVKASGGCSAPASKDAAAARAAMGKMKLRQYGLAKPAAASRSPLHEVQVMIRHPNNSGLQTDQLTGYNIPAHFVQSIRISQGARLVIDVEGAISLSENPAIRFRFRQDSGEKLNVKAIDTDQNVFAASWDVKADKSDATTTN